MPFRPFSWSEVPSSASATGHGWLYSDANGLSLGYLIDTGAGYDAHIGGEFNNQFIDRIDDLDDAKRCVELMVAQNNPTASP